MAALLRSTSIPRLVRRTELRGRSGAAGHRLRCGASGGRGAEGSCHGLPVAAPGGGAMGFGVRRMVDVVGPLGSVDGQPARGAEVAIPGWTPAAAAQDLRSLQGARGGMALREARG